jgi:hypothetical protein
MMRDRFRLDFAPGSQCTADTSPNQQVLQAQLPLLRFRVFENEILDFLSNREDFNFTKYDTDTLVDTISHLVKVGDSRAHRAISAISSELMKIERERDIEGIRNPGSLVSLVDVMSGLKKSHIPIVSLCIDCLASQIWRLEAELIISVLKSLSKSSLKHPTFTGSLVFVLPVIPCTDEELREIVRLLLQIGLDNTEDSQFISNLVRFRTVTIIE